MNFLQVFAIGIGGFILYELVKGGSLNPQSVTVPSVANPGALPTTSVPSLVNLFGGTGLNSNPLTNPYTPNITALLNATSTDDGLNTLNPAGTYGDVTGIGSVANNDVGYLVGD
jgi:hypothetical protein